MPLHKIRKRYVLFKAQKDDALPSRLQFEEFLSSFDDAVESEETKPSTRLLIFDSRTRMGIIKTRHTMVSTLKTQLSEGSQRIKFPKFQVIAVSGTIKKLKLKLFAINPN